MKLAALVDLRRVVDQLAGSPHELDRVHDRLDVPDADVEDPILLEEEEEMADTVRARWVVCPGLRAFWLPSAECIGQDRRAGTRRPVVPADRRHHPVGVFRPLLSRLADCVA